MCRNIKTLFNFDPPVTDEEIRVAALQFVRKVSGFNKPSKTNEAAFLAAVDEVAAASRNLLSSLETNAPPRDRAKEVARARARTAHVDDLWNRTGKKLKAKGVTPATIEKSIKAARKKSGYGDES
jgi:hypothetical protein